MNRRNFLKLAALSPAALLALQTGCARRSGVRRVMVLGIDGMDPELVQRYIIEGIMPNAAAVSAVSGLNRLGTGNPPQSPVAWSDFITGHGPEVHGIFDFIHRDPSDRMPYLSTSRVVGPGRTLHLGDWRLPLSGARVELLRKGEPFWKTLTDEGIPVKLVKLPVDFPPGRDGATILSDLGTPDLRGSQGSFTFFTDDARSINDDTSGGIVMPVRDYGDSCYRCRITGPENSMRAGSPEMEVEISVWADREAGAVRLDVQGSSHLLALGEWSPWIRIRFDAIPHLSSITGIARFYLKELSPKLKLYMSPLNIDPMDPALPISEPGDYSASLARDLGPFYTQGFPEDTKALSRGVLSDEEYLQQAYIVLQERGALFTHELSRFREGLLFCYFGSLDLNVHMFYRTLDIHSPLHASTDPRFTGVIRDLYRRMDAVIGQALDAMDGDSELIILSDHGFAPFNRAFNLNSWLAAEGFARIGSPSSRGMDMFAATDWSGTAAYGLGLNSLYLNRAGREPGGVVSPGEADDVLRNLKNALEAVTDPLTGRRVVSRAFICSETFPGPLPDYAPDMIVGYDRGFRSSWETTLGSYPEQILTDNTDPWSGDHCVDPSVVPGTLLATKPLAVEEPTLKDMGRSIAALFGVQRLPSGGRDLFGTEEA